MDDPSLLDGSRMFDSTSDFGGLAFDAFMTMPGSSGVAVTPLPVWSGL
ncbi:MAG: hypothetical protein KGY40_00320 [Thioalkalivibrio sp.]|nr:hypothetical protein [Thioalkalivibrio sp.]